MNKKVLALLFILFVTIVGITLLVWYLFRPIQLEEISFSSSLTQTYEEADEFIGSLQSLDDETINPVCKTRFFTQGEKAQKAIVIYHGFTNCPKQFAQLGWQLYEEGYNVFIPRMPYHGYEDRMTQDIDNLTLKDIILFTNETLDMAGGLGEEIQVMGLSSGGVMTTWAIQNRRDISAAVIIAPVLGKEGIPRWLATPTARVSRLVPHYFVWWDSNYKDFILGPEHAYPRFSLRSIGNFLYLGGAVVHKSQEAYPLADSVHVVTNASDSAVSQEMTDELIENWKNNGATNVSTYQFEKGIVENHDIIDPDQPEANIDVVYPKLIELLQND